GVRSTVAAIRGVVHAWALDSDDGSGILPADPVEAQQCGSLSAMLLARALVTESPAPRLWLVTRLGQQTDPEDRALSPVQAPMWGLARALSVEYPELRCVAVDLDAGGDQGQIGALAAELTGSGDEPELAYRRGERRAARLVSFRASGSRDGFGAPPWRLV